MRKQIIKLKTFAKGSPLPHHWRYHSVKVGLYHRPNQIIEVNDSRGGTCFERPLKQERGHLETSYLVIMYTNS